MEKFKEYFNPWMSIREKEYLSHAITEFIIINYFKDSEEFKDEFTFYSLQERYWLDPIIDVTVKSISPQTIFQVDTNYNNFNGFACNVVGSMFYKFIYYDKNFLKNFITHLKISQISTIEDYLDLIVNSTNLKKIDDIPIKEWLESHPYFLRFKNEYLTRYSLDIIPISKFNNETYVWNKLTYIDPYYFIITGSSIKNLQPISGNYIDENFFDQDVFFKILNDDNVIVYEGRTKISPNFWNYINYIPNLREGKYKLIATRCLTGDLSHFSVHRQSVFK